MRYVVLAGTEREARDVCREFDIPPPPHRREGSQTLIFTASQAHLMRGFTMRDDDEVHWGYFTPGVSTNEFHQNLRAIEIQAGRKLQ